MRPSSASTPLSSSALNYLESLERNAKALRGNNNKKDESSIPTSKQISSSAPVKRRESFSDLINHARRHTSLSRTNSDDYDFLNESLKSSVFDESDSSESGSEESHEEKRILPLGTPGQQVGRKSLKDIRELRNSIDQSLIKTPELKMLRTKAGGDESKKQKQFESIREEDVPEDLPKVQLPSKSPFKKAIQSGSESSDADSIVFDEVFEEVLPSPPRKPIPAARSEAPRQAEPVKKKEKKKERTPTPTSSSSSSSSSSETSESSSSSDSSSESSTASSSTKTSTSKSTSKPTYGSDFESGKSSSSASSSSSPSSSKSSPKAPKVYSVKPPNPEKSKKEEVKMKSPVPYADFIPKRSSSSDSAKSTVRETHRTLEESLKTEKMAVIEPKRKERSKTVENVSVVRSSSPSTSSSAIGETERENDYRIRRERIFRSRRRRSEEPQTCQENIHNMIESVIDTHVQMLDEFNRMEYAAVCEWTDVLRRFERHDGPTSQRLREIVQRRLNRKY